MGSVTTPPTSLQWTPVGMLRCQTLWRGKKQEENIVDIFIVKEKPAVENVLPDIVKYHFNQTSYQYILCD